MTQLPCDTFRETLAIRYPHCGHALWDPSPEGLYDAVAVGDVGFIREGYFHRLFNVLLPEDHPSHLNSGVPENHQPLRPSLSSHIRKGTDGTDDFCSRYVTLSRGPDIHALGPDDDSQVTVSCPGRRGAVSSLPFPAQREDTVARGDFGKWMIKHIDLWFAFAVNLGLGVNRMQDIILVTGRHCAKSWVNVAFSEGQRDAEVSFGTQLSGVSGVNIERRLVHGDAVLKLGPTGENLPENQCIFIRGFRVVRLWNIWPRLRGRGPSPHIDEGESGPDGQLESIGTSANPNYEEPLHVLLQYIAEKSPGCDLALVHDDDLACIDGASLDCLQPDTLLEHLQAISPEIQQVEYDVLPSNESGRGATTKVATLSQDASNIGLSTSLINKSPIQGELSQNDRGQRRVASADDTKASSSAPSDELSLETKPLYGIIVSHRDNVANPAGGHRDKRASSFSSSELMPTILTAPWYPPVQPPTVPGEPKGSLLVTPPGHTSHNQLPDLSPSPPRTTLNTGGWGADAQGPSWKPQKTPSTSAGLPPGTPSSRGSIVRPEWQPPGPSALRKSYTNPVGSSSVVIAPPLTLSASLPTPIRQDPQSDPWSPEVLGAMEKVASDTEGFLRFEEDGTVLAGNLEGLVSRVIDGLTGSSTDDHFKTTFLTTYQLFSTSARLFEILKRRFEAADPDLAGTRSRYSILLFIESWIKKGFEDKDLTCSSKIMGFVLAISGPEELKAKAVEIANTIFDPDYVYLRQPKDIAWISYNRMARPPGMRPSDVATALTVLTGSHFRRITYWEYVNLSRKRSSMQGIESFNAFHKLVGLWVQRSIMEPAYLEDRAKIFEEWIYTAQACRGMNNFSSAYSIVTALLSRKVAMLVLACEAKATEILQMLDKELTPLTYFETLHQAEMTELIPSLDLHLSTLNSILLRSDPIVVVEGRNLINFKLCYELAEQINSIIQYSPPDVHSEARQDVLEYVEYNLQSSPADNTSVTGMAGNGKRTDKWLIPKRQGTTRSVGKTKLPTQGRLDVVRRSDGHMEKWRGDMAQYMEQRREQDKTRGHEQGTGWRRQEDGARRREEDMERWREDMARWREERARWGENWTRRRDEGMAERREEDMTRWRQDTARWLDDMSRWREERARRHERDKALWREGGFDVGEWGQGGSEAGEWRRGGSAVREWRRVVPPLDDKVERREGDKEPRREEKDPQREHSDSVPPRRGFMARLFDRRTAKTSS